MLKSRLIPCIITKGDLVVQSYNFSRYLPIGNIKTAIEFFVNWDVDEIVILDIDATKNGRSPNLQLVEWATTECFVPLTIGGGIKNTEDVKNLLNAGADKICVNTIALHNPAFISEASYIYGSQCVTVSIDVKLTPNGYRVYDHSQKVVTEKLPSDYAMELEALGTGEIFLNSVDRDGARTGYDIDLLKSVSSTLRIPVIACGGVGRFDHLPVGVLKGGCQAVAAANIFQHSEHSTIAAKSTLLNHGVDVRLSSSVKYENFEFDAMGRPY